MNIEFKARWCTRKFSRAYLRAFLQYTRKRMIERGLSVAELDNVLRMLGNEETNESPTREAPAHDAAA